MPLPLNKRVKARADENIDEYDQDYDSEDTSPSIIETGSVEADQIFSSGDDDEGEEGDDDDDDDDADGDADAQQKISNISFGTLARAQDSLSKKRKRGSEEKPQNDDKLEALRARLHQLREQKGLNKPAIDSHKRDDNSDREDDEDESGESSEDDEGAPKSRSSKHAPGSMSSKRQVTRKRPVVDAPKRQVRDPRFGPVGGRQDETKLQKNYAFLNDYAESEMSELKAAIKKTKNEDEKDTLKRKLLSMESKKKARESKDRQQQVLREHRKKERDAINQGKNPFYLKRSEQKQLALVDKYNSMKGRDREKLMERRRKKVAGKEKKMMPQARRMVG